MLRDYFEQFECLMERNPIARPLLSIGIVTRNRIPYAISALHSLLGIQDSRLQVVVQDNSDSRDLETYISENISDCRLVYRYTPPPFSSIDNFNAATELVTGEYVCLIGDDDGVNPEIMDAAARAKSEDLDALAVRVKAIYIWPNSGVPSTFFTKLPGGCLYLYSFDGRIVDADIDKEIRALLRNGCVCYARFDLPKLYQGLVHRRCLLAVREKIGNCFGGLSPDVFSSVAIASVARRVAITDYPLIISGVCRSSASALEGAVKRHSKKLEDAPHLRERAEYEWYELVPRVYTPQTIWADSGAAAFGRIGRPDLLREFNFYRLAAICIASNRGVTRIVLRGLLNAIRVRRTSLLVGICRFAYNALMGPCADLVQASWNRFLIIVGMKHNDRLDGLSNIVEASRALTKYLREKNRSFRDCDYH
jgi:hypothetical protein